MSASFEDIIAQVKALPVKKLSVCVAQDKNVLEACRVALDRGVRLRFFMEMRTRSAQSRTRMESASTE